jgi:hypothetical protein
MNKVLTFVICGNFFAKEYTELAENLKDAEQAKSKIKTLKTKIHINEKPG